MIIQYRYLLFIDVYVDQINKRKNGYKYDGNITIT